MSLTPAARSAITLQLLEAFLVLAETLHYGHAAEQLYVSQSTLSRQIQRLESALGVALFLRAGRTVSLTHAGRVMQTHAAIIVEQGRHAGAALAALEGGASQLLEVGCFGGVHGFLLPRVLAAFRDHHPAVSVRTTTMPSRDGLLRVRQGILDAAVVTSPPEPYRLEARSLFTEPLVVVLPEGHELAAGDRVRIADLAGQTLVTSAPGRSLRDLIDDALMQTGVNAHALVEIQDTEAVKDAVRTGIGLGILGETVARGVGRSSGLVARRLAPAVERQVLLVVQRQRLADLVVSDFADVAAETAEELGLVRR